MIVATTLLLAFAVLHPRSPGPVSSCIGTPASGSVRNAVSLPHHGANYTTYSTLGWLLGRQHVHSAVYATALDAMHELSMYAPHIETTFAETGWPWGGAFAPHRTHRNGTSIDIMVPVLRHDQPAPFPASPSNKFGYGIEFDNTGHYRDYRIDYDAMAAQLLALHAAAKQQQIGIDVVIFDNVLQQQLWKARDGRKLQQLVRFSKTPAWVRHDEHYHVNFKVPCALH